MTFPSGAHSPACGELHHPSADPAPNWSRPRERHPFSPQTSSLSHSRPLPLCSVEAARWHWKVAVCERSGSPLTRPAALCFSSGYNAPNRVTVETEKGLFFTATQETHCLPKTATDHSQPKRFFSFLPPPPQTCWSKRVFGKFYALSPPAVKSSQVFSS